MGGGSGARLHLFFAFQLHLQFGELNHLSFGGLGLLALLHFGFRSCHSFETHGEKSQQICPMGQC
jgi:hypothetical protein